MKTNWALQSNAITCYHHNYLTTWDQQNEPFGLLLGLFVEGASLSEACGLSLRCTSVTSIVLSSLRLSKPSKTGYWEQAASENMCKRLQNSTKLMKHESVIDRFWATLRCFMECGNLSNAVSPALLRSHWMCHPALHFHRAASLSIELTCHPAMMPRNAPQCPFDPNIQLFRVSSSKCLQVPFGLRNCLKMLKV